MKTNTWIVIVVVALLIIGGVYYMNKKPTSPQPTPSPETNENVPQNYNVEIANMAFNPAELTIKAGDTVIWTNMDSVPHMINSLTGIEIVAPAIYKSQTYKHTFDEAGTFNYFCKLHPSMKGTIIVQ